MVKSGTATTVKFGAVAIRFQDFGDFGCKKYLEGSPHAIYIIFIFNSAEFRYPNL